MWWLVPYNQCRPDGAGPLRTQRVTADTSCFPFFLFFFLFLFSFSFFFDGLPYYTVRYIVSFSFRYFVLIFLSSFSWFHQPAYSCRAFFVCSGMKELWWYFGFLVTLHCFHYSRPGFWLELLFVSGFYLLPSSVTSTYLRLYPPRLSFPAVILIHALSMIVGLASLLELDLVPS